ncbi:DNA polymerase Y family protein [Terriglobus tenax]|uniref:DNA polymerase Y family protein n=1 Tax=Terriglobus tenax TaxID=1111115 RepID=UPI0021DFCCFD|nr:DNA polymerase Y family protein [Terriglobus tenax]
MKKLPELYACIYAREFPAQSLLRLRPEVQDKPAVVLQGEAPAQTVCALNTRARLQGLRRGMTKVEVDTFESVAVLERSLRTEDAVRKILLECAGHFSPRIEDRSIDGVFVCVLDASGTESLFGPPLMLAKQLRQRVRAVGITAFVTISANLHTSICLARGMTGGTPLQVVRRGEEAKALATLPIAVLDMTEAQEETFRVWGIRSVGALSALPEKSLISRLGQDGKRLLQLARGERPHLLQPMDVPFVLAEQIELDFPLDDLESLLFGLATMLEQLILRAKSRVYALASVTITLHLDGGGSHERTVNPRVPTNDKQLWLKLLHLDLQGYPPSASILAVHLHAEPGATSKVQLGLFSPQLPEPGRLDVTLARIAAIVGDGNVGQAVLDDTRRASDFHVERFAIPSSEPVSANTASRLCLRVLRPAERTTVAMRSGRPCAIYFRSRQYAVEQVYGPWLSGGDWWNEAIWGNEQWDVVARAKDRAFLACRLARDFIQNDWHVAGLYD